jgi:hypothetical protein
LPADRLHWPTAAPASTSTGGNPIEGENPIFGNSSENPEQLTNNLGRLLPTDSIIVVESIRAFFVWQAERSSIKTFAMAPASHAIESECAACFGGSGRQSRAQISRPRPLGTEQLPLPAHPTNNRPMFSVYLLHSACHAAGLSIRYATNPQRRPPEARSRTQIRIRNPPCYTKKMFVINCEVSHNSR